MYNKKNLICMLVIIIVFLNGICFEQAKMYSNEIYSLVDEKHPSVIAFHTPVDVEDLCTSEILGYGYHNNVELQEQAWRFLNQQKVVKFSYISSYINIYSLSYNKFFRSSKAFQLKSKKSEELVLNYIHQADGKKHF